MKNEEIDLADIYDVFKKTSTFKFLEKNLSVIINNKIWIALFLLCGLTLGYFYQQNKPAIYKYEMIVDSKGIDNHVSQQMIATLNLLIQERNHTDLQKKNITKELSDQIQKITTTPSKTKKNTFILKIQTNNNSNLASIEDILINYLNETRLSVEVREDALQQLRAVKAELISKIEMIDSAQFKINELLKTNANTPFNNTSDLITERTSAKIKIVKLNREILKVNNYSPLTGLTPSTFPPSSNGNYPLKFGLLAFILGFLILRVFKK